MASSKTLRMIRGWMDLTGDQRLSKDAENAYKRISGEKTKNLSIRKKIKSVSDFMQNRLEAYDRQKLKKPDDIQLSKRIDKITLLLKRADREMSAEVSIKDLGSLAFFLRKVSVSAEQMLKEVNKDIFNRLQEKNLRGDGEFNSREYHFGIDDLYTYTYTLRSALELRGNTYRTVMDSLKKALGMESGDVAKKALRLTTTQSLHITDLPRWLSLYDEIQWESAEAKKIYKEASTELDQLFKDLFKKENKKAYKRFSQSNPGGKIEDLSARDIYNLTFSEVFGEEISQNPTIQKFRTGFKELNVMIKNADISTLPKA